MKFEHPDAYFTRFTVSPEEHELVVGAARAGLAWTRKMERHTKAGTVEPTSEYVERLLQKVVGTREFHLDRDEIGATRDFLLDQADAATGEGTRALTPEMAEAHEEIALANKGLAMQFGPAIRPANVN